MDVLTWFAEEDRGGGERDRQTERSTNTGINCRESPVRRSYISIILL